MASQVREIAQSNGFDVCDEEFARFLDKKDELSSCRLEFHYPKNKTLPPVDLTLVDGEEDCLYFCSNSLGLMPRKAEEKLSVEFQKWAEMGVYGHFSGDFPWIKCDGFSILPSAKLVGAKPGEIAIMNSLTVNLHILMVPFYRPTPTRHCILIEDKAFPSDHYAVESQIRFHGYDPKDSLILAKREEGAGTWTTKSILELIEKEGERVALVLFSGVHYFTGQFFDMKAITEAGHKKGCIVGFDLAHAVGNVPMHLHDWDVDFAAWCTYKYLSAGAGALSGVFINDKHTNNPDLPRFCGWWGHEMSTRFVMDNKMKLSPGASGFQISNASFMTASALQTSLEIFDRIGIEKLRKKSLILTGYLELLLEEKFSKDKNPNFYVEIITPKDPAQRGCQLSIQVSVPIANIKKELDKRGVVCDTREPGTIRLAPAPMVNRFHDVWRFIRVLEDSAKTVFNL